MNAAVRFSISHGAILSVSFSLTEFLLWICLFVSKYEENQINLQNVGCGDLRPNCDGYSILLDLEQSGTAQLSGETNILPIKFTSEQCDY